MIGYDEDILAALDRDDDFAWEWADYMKRATTKPRGTQATAKLSKARLAVMAEEATTDAHDESEQATGWFTMFDEHLELPFETKVLGTAVRDSCQIAAICTRGRDRQSILLVDLPLPLPKPTGTDWTEAYGYWLGAKVSDVAGERPAPSREVLQPESTITHRICHHPGSRDGLRQTQAGTTRSCTGIPEVDKPTQESGQVILP